jgi:hypothetical protein
MGQGSAVITATSEGRSGTATVVVTAPAQGGSLAEPFFNPGTPGHVSHIYEDWSTYGSVQAIASTNRVDGGLPWGVSDVSGISFTSGDPYGGTKALTMDYRTPVTGSPPATYGRGIKAHNFSVGSRWRNVTGAEETIVVEWAVKMSGTGAYLGKTIDFWQGGFTGNAGRWNYDPSYSTLGKSGTPCDQNPLCQRYWTNNGATRTALGASLKSPPTADTWAPQFFHDTQEQLWAPTSIYKQNMNWGTGAGEFAWGESARNMVDDRWRRFKWRLTRSQPGVTHPLTGTQNGYGRVEMWVDGIKIMEFIGDVGGRDEGHVFVGPRSFALISTGIDIHFYDLVATIHQGGALVHLGYIRIWSHQRQ